MAVSTKGTKKEAKKGTTVNVYGMDGKVKGKVDLPEVFHTPYRPDLIRRAVVAAQANRRQRYGPSRTAGMRHAVSTWGKGRGVARVQRITGGRRGAESPNNVGGRRAHPPRPEHSFEKKINVKERRLARASALAAVSMAEIVKARGHSFGDKVTLPIVVEDQFGSMERARDVQSTLSSLGLLSDVERARRGIHIRAGRGKMRGRRYRRPRSILIVAPAGSSILKGARNLAGVNTATPENLNTEDLAPGGDPGRLVVFTRSALQKLGGE